MTTEIHAQARAEIQVLLATYNGAPFLRSQIDSVLAQEDVEVRILARDDGSTDGTQAILAEYAAARPGQFEVIHDGEATRAAQRNFARLLAASTAPYVAFCDQDDVWLPNKLTLEMQRMQQLEQQHSRSTPLLVYTDLKVVDADLKTLSGSLWHTNGLQHAASPTFGSLLAENVVTGCTALLNRALVHRMLPLPDAALMHDHWAALIAASTGAMAGLPQATVLYRQHGNNVVGAANDLTLLQRLARIAGAQAVAHRSEQYRKDRGQSAALLQYHGSEMSPDTRAAAEAFVTLESMPRLERLCAVRRYGLLRANPQRKLTQLLDLLRTPRTE